MYNERIDPIAEAEGKVDEETGKIVRLMHGIGGLKHRLETRKDQER